MAPPRVPATSTFALDGGAAPVGVAVGAPLISTKLRAPAASSAYRERPRVSALLDRGLEDNARLTLLSAPPGYGKTVAATTWLASRRLASAWLSLDAADNDLTRFVRYLVAALREVRPGAGDATLGLFGPGTNPSADLVAATLLAEIATSDDTFVLVLDDYQAIRAEPVHHLIRVLIERGPPFTHLVLLTREDPPLPLARLRAHRQLVELRADELRYANAEAFAYLDGSGLGLQPELVERLVARTEGWIAGLQLAAISLADRPDAASVIDAFGGSQRFVLDYLADEVLAGIGADLRSFLIRTSVADRFDAGLGAALAGRKDCEDLLRQAERANLFLVALDAERHWFRYHGLFADYLRAQLGEDERRDLHDRAATYLEAEGLGQEAIAHAVAAGSIDLAIRLIEREARPAFEAGELATVLGWLDSLPAERLAASGELVPVQAWALLFAGQPAAALACADRHLGGAWVGGPVEGRLLALRALLATVTGPDAEQLAGASLELLGEHDDFFRALTLQALGMAQWSDGRLAAAVDTWRWTVEVATRTRQPMALFPAVTALANGLNETGQRNEGEALCRTVLEDHADPRGRPRPIEWWVRIPLGLLRYEANDLVEARRELEYGFAAAGSQGDPLLAGWAVGYLALARQTTGLPGPALEVVRAVARATREAGMALPGKTREIEARILLMQGDVAGAARWADRATPEAPAGSPLLDLFRNSQDVTRARVRLAQGRPTEACALLAPVRAAAEATGALADLISIRVLWAVGSEASGRRAEARQALEEAVTLAAPNGYVRRIVDDARGIAHLLPFVRRIAPAFVDQVLEALAASPSAAGGRRSRGPWLWRDDSGELVEALTERERDVLRLMVKGATNAEIAEGLGVSVGTARWHVGNILSKLGVRSRTQAVVRAQQLGLV